MSSPPENRQAFVGECIAKAKCLYKLGLIACVIFVVAAFRLYPYWQSSRTLFFSIVAMIFVSMGFHLIMRKAVSVLGNNPSDEEVVKWGDFLELYYVPKYFIRKEEKNWGRP